LQQHFHFSSKISTVRAFDLFELPKFKLKYKVAGVFQLKEFQDVPTHTSTQVGQLLFFHLNIAYQALEKRQ